MVRYTGWEKKKRNKMAETDGPTGNSVQNGTATPKQTPTNAGTTGEMSRPNNLQRIAQKKQLVRSYSREKKLEKLAVYSSCKVDNPFMFVF